MLKMDYNFVMFENEKNEAVLLQYIERLNNEYHLRTITVLVRSDYWKLICEGTDKAWKTFTSSKNTKFKAEKDDDNIFTYVIERF